MSLLPLESFAQGQLGRIPTEAPSPTNWAALPIPAGAPALTLKRANAFWFVPESVPHTRALAAKDRTHFILSRTGEIWMLWLALPGAYHISHFEARDNVPGICWTTDTGADASQHPLVYQATGLQAHQLVEEAVQALKAVMPFHRTRSEKRAPEWLSGLGWCTWDAFYHDVDAAGVEAGLKTFSKAEIPLQFVIIDDGWQEVDGWRLRSTEANPKFPGGLKEMARKVKAAGIPHLGVWHTLMGYWHGVDAEGPIAKRYRVLPVAQTTTDFKGWPDLHDPSVRCTLHPDDAADFYQKFYQELAAAGIDFTKVDCQSATPYFVEGTFPVAQSFTRYQSAFQGATSVSMRQGAIHCMANDPSILWRHATGTVWRNSDDFYPKKPFPAQADHVYNNLMNALLTRAFAVPDWDMFQTTHASGALHAATRALSGGPVYVSDKPGNHDVSLLKRLVTSAGAVPRFPQPARPVETSLLQDPRREPVPLQVFNESAGIGQLCLANCLSQPEPAPIVARWNVRDALPQLSPDQLVVLHNPISGEVRTVTASEALEQPLAANGGLIVWTLSPVLGNGIAPLGHVGVYASAAVVQELLLLDGNQVAIRYRHGGEMAVWSKTKPASLSSGGKPFPHEYDAQTKLTRFTVPEGHAEAVVVSL
ncbi:MAG: Sip1-related alpha-galactosidase [Opitutaceae bacterium]|nr:Sip1-related alpha-galactosidase [Opitutaceae bacterium]